MKGVGHDVGKMTAEEKERTAKALVQLRDRAVATKRAFQDHCAECPACGRESVFHPTGVESALTGIRVVVHCARGYKLELENAGAWVLWQANQATAASFGVTLP